MTSETSGANFKYDYDYVRLSELIQKYVPAWRVEIEKYFVLVVFNYLFSNGDAHLKNFALLESQGGDYLLSPAYDMINTRIHVDDSSFALSGGILNEEIRSSNYSRTGKPEYQDFVTFGKQIGIPESRIEKLLIPFCARNELVDEMIQNSFLNEASQRGYLLGYNRRRNQLSK